MNENCFETKKGRLSVSCSLASVCDGWACASVCAGWAHLLPNPPHPHLCHWRAVKRGGEGDGGWVQEREEGDEMLRGMQEGGKTQWEASSFHIFCFEWSSERVAIQTHCEWVFYVMQQGTASKEQRLNSAAPQAKVWLVGGAYWGPGLRLHTKGEPTLRMDTWHSGR